MDACEFKRMFTGEGNKPGKPYDPLQDAESHMGLVEDRLQLITELPDKLTHPRAHYVAARGIFRRSVTGKARRWCKDHFSDFETFGELKEAFLTYFSDIGRSQIDFENAWGNLRLEKGEEIEDYAKRVRDLAERMNKPQELIVYAFTGGLPNSIRHCVMPAQSLEEAIRLARYSLQFRKERHRDVGYAPTNAIEEEEEPEEEIDYDEVAAIVKRATPPKQKNVVPSIQDMYKLLIKIDNRTKPKQGSPTAPTNFSKPTKATPTRVTSVKTLCFYCKKAGHFKKDCPEFTKERNKTKELLKLKLAHLIGVEEEEEQDPSPEMDLEEMRALESVEEIEEALQSLNQPQS